MFASRNRTDLLRALPGLLAGPLAGTMLAGAALVGSAGAVVAESPASSPSEAAASAAATPPGRSFLPSPSTVTAPDHVVDHAGGIAARVRTADGSAVPGDVFLLMAVDGAVDPASVYDGTPYVHRNATLRPETIGAGRDAARAVGDALGRPVDPERFTSAPGGGPSGGLIYAIAYLNLLTDGAFTDGLRVAATGRIDGDGYVDRIDAVDGKTVAAAAAGADVLFTATLPSDDVVAAHAGRVAGEMFRVRHTDLPLATERAWDHYERWGADRTAGDLDVIGVRHLGDVAAYLCAAGSATACDVRDALAGVVTGAVDGVTIGAVGQKSLPQNGAGATLNSASSVTSVR